MPITLDRFAENACADLLSHGVAMPLLEAHTDRSIYAFPIAQLAAAVERQRALALLGAHFGNDPATADQALTDLFLRPEAKVGALGHGKRQRPLGVGAEPLRFEALMVTHMNPRTGALDIRMYLMRRNQVGRLIGLTAYEDLRDDIKLDLLCASFLAGVRVGRSAPRGSYPPLALTDFDLRPQE
jgi:hypothetical protein